MSVQRKSTSQRTKKVSGIVPNSFAAAARLGVFAAISYIVGRMVLAVVCTVASLVSAGFLLAILAVLVFGMGANSYF